MLGELLHSAGVEKSSAIWVTGPAGLAALLWLCRHGYEQVGYVRRGSSPPEGADLLLAPQTCDLASLQAILVNGPHPKDGGVLIVQTPEPAAHAANDPVHVLLAENGYEVERCLHGHHRELHVARRRLAPERRKAA